jgi:hypothetical protein
MGIPVGERYGGTLATDSYSTNDEAWEWSLRKSRKPKVLWFPSRGLTALSLPVRCLPSRQVRATVKQFLFDQRLPYAEIFPPTADYVALGVRSGNFGQCRLLLRTKLSQNGAGAGPRLRILLNCDAPAALAEVTLALIAALEAVQGHKFVPKRRLEVLARCASQHNGADNLGEEVPRDSTPLQRVAVNVDGGIGLIEIAANHLFLRRTVQSDCGYVDERLVLTDIVDAAAYVRRAEVGADLPYLALRLSGGRTLHLGLLLRPADDLTNKLLLAVSPPEGS